MLQGNIRNTFGAGITNASLKSFLLSPPLNGHCLCMEPLEQRSGTHQQCSMLPGDVRLYWDDRERTLTLCRVPAVCSHWSHYLHPEPCPEMLVQATEKGIYYITNIA